jgi:hypothetical protein
MHWWHISARHVKSAALLTKAWLRSLELMNTLRNLTNIKTIAQSGQYNAMCCGRCDNYLANAREAKRNQLLFKRFFEGTARILHVAGEISMNGTKRKNDTVSAAIILKDVRLRLGPLRFCFRIDDLHRGHALESEGFKCHLTLVNIA